MTRKIDGEIDFPEVTVPNIIVIMSQEAFSKYGHKIRKRGHMLIDEDLVKIEVKEAPEKVKILAIPSTRFAEELGRKIVANIVMVGFLTAVSEVVSLEAMKKSLLGSVPKGTEELNMSALMKGYDFGVDLLKTLKSRKNTTNNQSKKDK
jgi:2-oxoglutarate ferredoxin oxidoreductase subunit gamma